MYDKLNDDYEACVERAGSVEERIDKVEQIAADLFKEWEKEIDEMTNAKFKAKSRQSLQTTKRRYARLNNAQRSKPNPGWNRRSGISGITSFISSTT